MDCRDISKCCCRMGLNLFTVFHPENCISPGRGRLLSMAPRTRWAGEQLGVHLLLLVWSMSNLTPGCTKGQQPHYQSWADSAWGPGFISPFQHTQAVRCHQEKHRPFKTLFFPKQNLPFNEVLMQVHRTWPTATGEWQHYKSPAYELIT